MSLLIEQGHFQVAMNPWVYVQNKCPWMLLIDMPVKLIPEFQLTSQRTLVYGHRQDAHNVRCLASSVPR